MKDSNEQGACVAVNALPACNPHIPKGDLHAPLYRYPKSRVSQVLRVGQILEAYSKGTSIPDMLAALSTAKHTTRTGKQVTVTWGKGDNGRYGTYWR